MHAHELLVQCSFYYAVKKKQYIKSFLFQRDSVYTSFGSRLDKITNLLQEFFLIKVDGSRNVTLKIPFKMRYTYFDHPVHNVLIHFTIINQSNTIKSCLQVLPLEIRGCALNAFKNTSSLFAFCFYIYYMS